MERQETSGRGLECDGLVAEYGQLREAICASAAIGDDRAEDRLRNRAQALLCRMVALRCLTPDPAELGT